MMVGVKPRLRRHGERWACALSADGVVGYGSTPAMAWLCWLGQMNVFADPQRAVN